MHNSEEARRLAEERLMNDLHDLRKTHPNWDDVARGLLETQDELAKVTWERDKAVKRADLLWKVNRIRKLMTRDEIGWRFAAQDELAKVREVLDRVGKWLSIQERPPIDVDDVLRDIERALSRSGEEE